MCKVVHDLDPNNILTAVLFSHGVPRALAVIGVPVALVAQLDTYGVLISLSGATRAMAMETCKSAPKPRIARLNASCGGPRP